MENREIDKIKDKIAKLIKLQKGAEAIGSVEEAANAAARIQEMLFKYNIELSEISSGDTSKQSNVVNEYFHIDKEFGYNKTESTWLSKLMFILCEHNLCSAILLNSGMAAKLGYIKMDLFGEKHNLEVVKYMFTYFSRMIRDMRVKSYKQDIKNAITFETKKTYYRAYSNSFVIALNSKLSLQQAKNKQNFEGGSQLMVINKEALNTEISKNYPVLKSTKTRKLSGVSGASAGKRDGYNANINPGIN